MTRWSFLKINFIPKDLNKANKKTMHNCFKITLKDIFVSYNSPKTLSNHQIV